SRRAFEQHGALLSVLGVRHGVQAIQASRRIYACDNSLEQLGQEDRRGISRVCESQ
ncbi:unnamed protein product, partial [Ostreobium quekettii]